MGESWPDRIRDAIVAPQLEANEEALKHEQMGDATEGNRVRMFGRMNGIENGLIELSRQLQELRDKAKWQPRLKGE
ncbi:MAG TPA: hypothetical protein VK821_04410 [Dehalococcoidia bacterium]|nr:hypothetical protein [Dehalococcoidia bacterium]